MPTTRWAIGWLQRMFVQFFLHQLAIVVNGPCVALSSYKIGSEYLDLHVVSSSMTPPDYLVFDVDIKRGTVWRVDPYVVRREVPDLGTLQQGREYKKW